MKTIIENLKVLGKSKLIAIRILGEIILSGVFNDMRILEEELSPLLDKNVYFSLQSINENNINVTNKLEGCKSTISDKDILFYNWILVDLDPIRTSTTSSTDEELESSKKLANKIEEGLSLFGFPSPIVACSGNGYHLLYKVNFKNNTANVTRVKSLLSVLDEEYSNSKVTVDTSVYNPSRICRLYGTVNHKGKNTKERPHRESFLDKIPENIKILDIETIDDYINSKKVDIKAVSTKKARFTNGNIDDFIANYNVDVSSIKEMDYGKVYVLSQCPWNNGHDIDNGSYLISYPDGSISAGCHHDKCSMENIITLFKSLDFKDYKILSFNRSSLKEKTGTLNEYIQHIKEHSKCFVDDFNSEYMFISTDDINEVFPIYSSQLKKAIIRIIYNKFGKSPNSYTISSIQDHFSAFCYENQYSLKKRICVSNDAIYYDLGNSNKEIVIISKDGFHIKPSSDKEILFNRSNIGEQVAPSSEDSKTDLMELLRPFFNLNMKTNLSYL
ncbi:hypothetical protein [Miniphocaeibacter halophilus]|uniref:Uncharacterized protein n=1 Tax=Miniphocaeibacter halophilus TaxID=2931922 RepID=A0AC61MTW2_9FIRM|nr:hypothetical protein [Miniphocaeibacter halophilus]QQK09021.1 hypothetical protein JFY71_05650 [Miniphocaeibacter halophilus]